MNTTYRYKDKTYTNIYPLSEALGKEGIFIPLSITEESLASLGVEVTHKEEPIESIKDCKIESLKMQRDKAEVEPIEYNGHTYDYDSKARDRINVAITYLDFHADMHPTIAWTTADNQDTILTVDDLRKIVVLSAVRSDKLHRAYRFAKEKVLEATTKEQVDEVTLNNEHKQFVE